MSKPPKLLSQQNEIKDNLKNLTFWGFTLTSIMQRDTQSYHRVSDIPVHKQPSGVAVL